MNFRWWRRISARPNLPGGPVPSWTWWPCWRTPNRSSAYRGQIAQRTDVTLSNTPKPFSHQVRRHQPGAGLRLRGATLADQVFKKRLDLAAVRSASAAHDVGVRSACESKAEDTSVAALPAMVSAGAAVAAVAPNTSGRRQQRFGARAAANSGIRRPGRLRQSSPFRPRGPPRRKGSMLPMRPRPTWAGRASAHQAG